MDLSLSVCVCGGRLRERKREGGRGRAARRRGRLRHTQHYSMTRNVAAVLAAALVACFVGCAQGALPWGLEGGWLMAAVLLLACYDCVWVELSVCLVSLSLCLTRICFLPALSTTAGAGVILRGDAITAAVKSLGLKAASAANTYAYPDSHTEISGGIKVAIEVHEVAAVPGNASWSLAAVNGTAKTQLGVTLNAHFYGKVHFKACKKVSFSVRFCEVLAQHVCAL